jgi:hypothetical protein
MAAASLPEEVCPAAAQIQVLASGIFFSLMLFRSLWGLNEAPQTSTTLTFS